MPEPIIVPVDQRAMLQHMLYCGWALAGWVETDKSYQGKSCELFGDAVMRRDGTDLLIKPDGLFKRIQAPADEAIVAEAYREADLAQYKHAADSLERYRVKQVSKLLKPVYDNAHDTTRLAEI